MSSLVCLSPRRVSAALALIAVGLALISIIGLLAGGRFLIFNVNGERNIPAWFSTSLLLSCSALLALIACVKKARFEETLEMCGAIVFIYALMTYINLDLNHIRIYFSDKTIPANLLEQQL